MSASRLSLGTRRVMVGTVAAVVLAAVIALPAAAATCSSKGTCMLVFTSQPKEAKVGDSVTATPFDPTAGAVSVAIEYTSTGLPVTTYSDPIVLQLLAASTNTGSGTLSGTTSVVPTNGIASFPGISIDTAGLYSLKATSGTRVTPGTSTPFSVWTFTNKCTTGTECGGPLSGPHETVNISDTTLTGTLAFSVGAENTTNPCLASLTGKQKKWQFGPNVTQIGGITLSGGNKTVTLTYDQAYVNAQPENGASFYQICYQSDTAFHDITGALVNVGILPLCDSQGPVAPCVLSKTKNTGSGVVTISVLLPGSDPKIW